MYVLNESTVIGGQIVAAGALVDETCVTPSAAADLQALELAGKARRLPPEPDKLTRDDSQAQVTKAPPLSDGIGPGTHSPTPESTSTDAAKRKGK